MDWLAHALPYEGTADLVSRHITDAGAVDVVTSSGGVVIGRRTGGEDGAVTYGPTTVRPSEERSALDERMARRNVDRILVTDSEGRLLGAYERHAG